MMGVGSEWSVSFPGYLAGAVEAVEMGVAHYLRRVALA
jgi:monoamine oxidase